MASSKVNILLGLARVEAGEFDDAFRLLKAASEATPLDPDLPGALSELASGAFNQAGAQMDNPAETIRLNQLAIAAYGLREGAQKSDYDLQILSAAKFNLGAILHALGQESEAIKQYDDVLALMPERWEVAINLAILLSEANRADEAVRILAPFVAQHPTNGRLVTQLIVALQQARSMDEAVALTQRAAIHHPDIKMMYCGYYYRYTKGGVVFTA